MADGTFANKFSRKMRWVALHIVLIALIGWVVKGYVLPRAPLAGETSHDFGVIPMDFNSRAELQHTFHLSNPGSRPVTIRSIKPDCGCVRIGVGSTIVEPGQSIDVPVTLELSSPRKTVMIHMDLGDAGIQTLKVRAAAQFSPHLSANVVLLSITADRPATAIIMAEIFDTDVEPASPQIAAPQSLAISFEGWRLTWRPKDIHAAPCQWQGTLSVRQVGDLPPDAAITIELKSAAPLKIPVGP